MFRNSAKLTLLILCDSQHQQFVSRLHIIYLHMRFDSHINFHHGHNMS